MTTMIEACEKGDRSVCSSLKLVRPDVFTNGGDQTNDSIPEAAICKEMGTQLVDKLGEKINSSSWLIAKSRGEEVKVKFVPCKGGKVFKEDISKTGNGKARLKPMR